MEAQGTSNAALPGGRQERPSRPRARDAIDDMASTFAKTEALPLNKTPMPEIERMSKLVPGDNMNSLDFRAACKAALNSEQAELFAMRGCQQHSV